MRLAGDEAPLLSTFIRSRTEGVGVGVEVTDVLFVLFVLFVESTDGDLAGGLAGVAPPAFNTFIRSKTLTAP